MRTKLWTAAAVVLAVSGAAVAGEMSSGSGGGSNPASEKGVNTPKQPNETQPGMRAGAGDAKGMKGEKGTKGGKGEMKGDATSGGSGMSSSSSGGMSSSGGSSNPGNPAEKGARTPSQPNETQPGMGSNKK